jgi:hypothetical protein
MPTGPKGEKRPADVIGNAVKVMRIATGEETDELPDDGKDPAAKALGQKGGAARAKSMTPERRAEIAKKAAKARWGCHINFRWAQLNRCSQFQAAATVTDFHSAIALRR